MKTKIDIFSGFLGAGKTMLIKKLINEKLYTENIVIIENELGQVGIDGSILKRTNIEVKEINSGCICCTIAGDFKKAIEEIIEKYKPQRIIIEPSGVGKLSEVLGVIKDSELKNKLSVNMIITVIDVLKFEMYITNFSEFYKNQIINSNTIILSRTQNATIEKLQKVVIAARELNKNANIITTPWDLLKGETIIEVSEKDTKQDLMEKVNLLKRPIGKVVARKQSSNNMNNHFADEVFNSWGVETTNIFSEKALKVMLDSLSNSETYGLILRAKGIVQAGNNDWIQFDYVPEEFQIRRTTPDYTGRVCVIGSNLKKHNLKNLFKV
jgi:G3E family GTPase